MVFNATFNNISAISWRSALLVEETGGNKLKAIDYHIIYVDWSNEIYKLETYKLKTNDNICRLVLAS